MNMESIWQNYDLDTLERGIEQLFPGNHVSLESVFEQLLKGNFMEAVENLLSGIGTKITAPINTARNLFVCLMVLGLISALLSHFAEVMEVHQVADLSFYFSYLLFTTILLRCFAQIADTTTEALQSITLFIELLMPTYLVTVGAALGSARAAITCQIMLLVVYGVEKILIGLVIPLIYSYTLLSAINGIWTEEKLTLLLQLMEKAVGWILKGVIGLITGISLFQSLITPVIEQARNTLLQKAVSVIPGVGDIAEGAISMVLGSAMVIKNSVGVVLMLLILLLCAVPLTIIALTSVALKLAAALMGIVSDKRLCTCTNQAGDAGIMLLRATGTGILLFFISMAVVTASVRI